MDHLFDLSRKMLFPDSFWHESGNLGPRILVGFTFEDLSYRGRVPRKNGHRSGEDLWSVDPGKVSDPLVWIVVVNPSVQAVSASHPNR